jgi:hypothetical protein
VQDLHTCCSVSDGRDAYPAVPDTMLCLLSESTNYKSSNGVIVSVQQGTMSSVFQRFIIIITIIIIK